MPDLTSLILYIRAYISLVAMAEAIDSDYCAQFGSIVEPGQDLELEPLNEFYLHVPDNVSLPRKRLLYSDICSIDHLTPDLDIYWK